MSKIKTHKGKVMKKVSRLYLNSDYNSANMSAKDGGDLFNLINKSVKKKSLKKN